MARRSLLSRRTYLALAGGMVPGLAGCTSSEDKTESSTTTPADTATTAATPSATTTATSTTGGEETATPEESNGVKRMESAVASVEFEGEYVDTHAHWLPSMGPKMPSKYAPMMNKYDIGATVLFSPSSQAARDYEPFLKQLTEPGVEYLPFMSAPSPGRQLGNELRTLYDGKERAFWGIGEWKPQNEPFPPINGEQFTPLWELSADLDIPVMFHPKASQEGTVEPALKAHPDASFILHGHQMMGYGQEKPGLGPTLPRLLREYDNLYWQMDVGVMLSGRLLRMRSASTFADWYESNAEQVISLYQNILPKLLDAAPERVLWGTDIARHWNLEDNVFSLLIEFTEGVLEAVPEKHHASYKHENARKLFGF